MTATPGPLSDGTFPVTGSGSQHFCSFPVLQTHNHNLKGLTLRLCFVSLSHCNHPPPPAPLTDFLRGGEQAEEHHHPAGELHHGGHQEGVLHAETHHAVSPFTSTQGDLMARRCWGRGRGSDLVAVLQHHGSQEGTEDVTHRGAGAPQAEHEATPEKQGRARVLILKIKFIKTNKNDSLHLF